VGGAIACFRKAIAQDPKLASAHTNLGNALSGKGEVGGAIECWRKAIAIDPKDATAHYNLGVALHAQKDVGGAIACFQKAIAANPKFALAHSSLGAALHGKGDVEGAIACFRKAIAADAFADQPKLSHDLTNQHRYFAARRAVLAAVGQAADAHQVPDKVRLPLRRQALQWLRADLAQYAKLVQDGKPAVKEVVRQRLAHWQGDAGLASVRGKEALVELPEGEVGDWRKLWAEVDALRKRAGR
jgi:tetratricopeptide (TPR) repeat protein